MQNLNVKIEQLVNIEKYIWLTDDYSFWGM